MRGIVFGVIMHHGVLGSSWRPCSVRRMREIPSYMVQSATAPYSVHEVAADLTQHSICHGQFRHPSLVDTILNATFSGDRPPTVTQPKSFNPIPLLTIAFACTVVSGAAYNHLTG